MIDDARAHTVLSKAFRDGFYIGVGVGSTLTVAVLWILTLLVGCDSSQDRVRHNEALKRQQAACEAAGFIAKPILFPGARIVRYECEQKR